MTDSKVKELSQQALEGTENGAVQQTWKTYLVIDEPPDEPALININNVPACLPGNSLLVIGKKKSRKSLFLVYLISEYKGNKTNDILLCDTEQGKKQVWKSRERIFKLTGQYVNTLSLKGLSPEDRKNIIEQAIQYGNYKIVVIDGIRDLLSNINDPDQCTVLVTWIEKMTVVFSLSIINVLHVNKVDNNARGHIGTELLNKAYMTVELELDEKAQCTLVKCESGRDIHFESFAFTHNNEGLPEIVSVPIKGVVMTDTERKRRLRSVFDDSLLKYNELREGIKIHFDVGLSRAEKFIAEFIRLNWIVKNGRDRSPDTVYKLMI